MKILIACDPLVIVVFSESDRLLGHVPIIALYPGAKEQFPFASAEAQRLREPSACERENALLKERYGGRWVRVRGPAKLMHPLMFGIVALTATALLTRCLKFAKLTACHGRPRNPPPQPSATGRACLAMMVDTGKPIFHSSFARNSP